mmetsp:Transcript_12304/g.31906  ORF Transcript_12304/g.31906 Transcript_12304/m.31906 type:complete len:200 (+) Transcript_12304:1312-1911(+)
MDAGAGAAAPGLALLRVGGVPAVAGAHVNELGLHEDVRPRQHRAVRHALLRGARPAVAAAPVEARRTAVPVAMVAMGVLPGLAAGDVVQLQEDQRLVVVAAHHLAGRRLGLRRRAEHRLLEAQHDGRHGALFVRSLRLLRSLPKRLLFLNCNRSLVLAPSRLPGCRPCTLEKETAPLAIETKGASFERSVERSVPLPPP